MNDIRAMINNRLPNTIDVSESIYPYTTVYLGSELVDKLTSDNAEKVEEAVKEFDAKLTALLGTV